MDHDRHHRTGPPGLEVCVECARPFVVPVALLDLVDEGLYLLALECKNCGRLAVGVHEDAELEALEAGYHRATAEIEAAIETVEVARRPDELGDGG
ncbi:hypothetical protein FSW04_09210 [Baekduia soli]|uniref:Uncharacterized protein n=1 Tax=Baekduia soli TaxID=496014 RepID=A0A5B8U3W0_9ACTN|nr:hypothetical protein [Baekduia soli]QEC47734.1 hypothetical protein FSW04_09210 [Baekduia soli]